MNDAKPSLKQLNRTFIGSVLFIDIVGYAKRTVPEQHEMKELFNQLVAEAVLHVAPAERIMVDTGDGAAIAFLGDPEDALFATLALCDAIDAGRATGGEPGFVRMGINLGPLKVVRDLNGHTNMIGDGVNDAQRVMSFAEPGQVTVAHSYYDIISRFSHDYAQLFAYEGTRHDKHVRGHEVYRFGPVDRNPGLAQKLRDRTRARQAEIAERSLPIARKAAAAVAASTRKYSVAVAASARNFLVTVTALARKLSVAMAGPARKFAALARKVASAAGNRAKVMPRFGLIATTVGAASAVGAVWSWTATSQQPRVAAVAVAVSPEAPAGRQPGQGQKAEPAASDAKTASARKPGDKSAKTADALALGAADPKPGTIKLAVQPWGEIYINGNKRGITPPLKSIALPPGKHQVEIRNGQFAAYKETIDVKSGKDLTVRYKF